MGTTQRVDVAIVGGGSAGMAAANVACAYALQVCIIDERAVLGGQDAHDAPVREFAARMHRLDGFKHYAGATVWGLFPAEDVEGKLGSHHVQFYDSQGLRRVHARHVVIATGAYDAPVPFPGWHLPGVMSARGIGGLLSGQGIAPSGRVVLAGTQPHLLNLCDRLLAAGVRVQAIAFAQSMWEFLRASRSAGIAALWKIAALRRERIPVLFQQRLVEAVGGTRITAVRLRGPAGDSEFSCGALGVSFGNLAATELARQAGAQYAWADDAGWVIQVDAFMRSSVAGISVAGNEAGIDRHDMAILCGEIAATGIAVDSRRLDARMAEERTRARRKRLTKLKRIAVQKIGARHCQFRVAELERRTLICRCEDIDVGTLCDALALNPDVTSASAVKSLTRVGMGLCQGRSCEINVRRIIAQARGERLHNISSFAVRAPIKPLPIGLFAAPSSPFDHQELSQS